MTIVMISVKYYTTTVLHNNIISYLWIQKICPRPRPHGSVLGLEDLSSASASRNCPRLTSLQRKLGEIVEKDCQACKLNRDNAMDHNRWRKQITDDL